MNIPFLDLKEINKPYFDAFDSIASVVQSGWYIMGREGIEFEKSYAQYCESAHCIGVSNGLDAITLLLQACHFPAKTEVLVPSNTYIATIIGILRAGCIPVLVEPDERTFLIEAEQIKRKITPQTKALFFVELYGQTGDLSSLRALCLDHQLKFFCDAAQSHGVMFRGKRSASWFDGVAHSFYPTKNLGALGDAGAVTVNDFGLAQEVRTLRNYGSSAKYIFDYVGLNARLDEIQAHILVHKLPFLDQENRRRKAIANRYLSEIKHPDLLLPTTKQDHVWHLFVVQTTDRVALQEYLKQQGIGTEIHYPLPPHRQKALDGLFEEEFPVSEAIHQRVLSIPLHPRLSSDEVDYIIHTLNSWKKN